MVAALVDHVLGAADDAVDEMQKEFLWQRLPPFFPFEAPQAGKNASDDQSVNLQLSSVLRMKSADIARLTSGSDDDDGDGTDLRIYYSVDNSRICKEHEVSYIDCPAELEEAVAFVLGTYPSKFKVSDIPIEGDDEARIDIASELLDKGILELYSKEKL